MSRQTQQRHPLLQQFGSHCGWNSSFLHPSSAENYPLSCFGNLLNQQQEFLGLAVLIGPSHVLTSLILPSPAYNHPTVGFKIQNDYSKVVEINNLDGLSLLRIDSNLGDRFGYLGLVSPSSSLLYFKELQTTQQYISLYGGQGEPQIQSCVSDLHYFSGQITLQIQGNLQTSHILSSSISFIQHDKLGYVVLATSAQHFESQAIAVGVKYISEAKCTAIYNWLSGISQRFPIEPKNLINQERFLESKGNLRVEEVATDSQNCEGIECFRYLNTWNVFISYVGTGKSCIVDTESLKITSTIRNKSLLLGEMNEGVVDIVSESYLAIALIGKLAVLFNWKDYQVFHRLDLSSRGTVVIKKGNSQEYFVGDIEGNIISLKLNVDAMKLEIEANKGIPSKYSNINFQNGHQGPIDKLHFVIEKNQLMVASRDGIKVWDTKSQKNATVVLQLEGELKKRVTFLGQSKARFYVAGEDGQFRVYETSGKMIRSMVLSGPIKCGSFLNSVELALSDGNAVRVVNVITSEQDVFQVHSSPVHHIVSVSPTDFITADRLGSICKWSIAEQSNETAVDYNSYGNNVVVSSVKANKNEVDYLQTTNFASKSSPIKSIKYYASNQIGNAQSIRKNENNSSLERYQIANEPMQKSFNLHQFQTKDLIFIRPSLESVPSAKKHADQRYTEENEELKQKIFELEQQSRLSKYHQESPQRQLESPSTIDARFKQEQLIAEMEQRILTQEAQIASLRRSKQGSIDARSLSLPHELTASNQSQFRNYQNYDQKLIPVMEKEIGQLRSEVSQMNLRASSKSPLPTLSSNHHHLTDSLSRSQAQKSLESSPNVLLSSMTLHLDQTLQNNLSQPRADNYQMKQQQPLLQQSFPTQPSHPIVIVTGTPDDNNDDQNMNSINSIDSNFAVKSRQAIDLLKASNSSPVKKSQQQVSAMLVEDNDDEEGEEQYRYSTHRSSPLTLNKTSDNFSKLTLMQQQYTRLEETVKSLQSNLQQVMLTSPPHTAAAATTTPPQNLVSVFSPVIQKSTQNPVRRPSQLTLTVLQSPQNIVPFPHQPVRFNHFQGSGITPPMLNNLSNHSEQQRIILGPITPLTHSFAQPMPSSLSLSPPPQQKQSNIIMSPNQPSQIQIPQLALLQQSSPYQLQHKGFPVNSGIQQLQQRSHSVFQVSQQAPSQGSIFNGQPPQIIQSIPQKQDSHQQQLQQQQQQQLIVEENLRREIQQQQQQIQQMQTVIKNQFAEIQRQKQEILSVREVQKQLEAKEGEIVQEHQEGLKQLSEQLGTLSDLVKKLEKERDAALIAASSGAGIPGGAIMIEHLKHEVDRVSKESTRLASENRNQSLQLIRAEQSLSEARQSQFQVDTLRTSMQHTNSENEMLIQKIAQLETENASLNSKFIQFKEETHKKYSAGIAAFQKLLSQHAQKKQPEQAEYQPNQSYSFEALRGTQLMSLDTNALDKLIEISNKRLSQKTTPLTRGASHKQQSLNSQINGSTNLSPQKSKLSLQLSHSPQPSQRETKPIRQEPNSSFFQQSSRQPPIQNNKTAAFTEPADNTITGSYTLKEKPNVSTKPTNLSLTERTISKNSVVSFQNQLPHQSSKQKLFANKPYESNLILDGDSIKSFNPSRKPTNDLTSVHSEIQTFSPVRSRSSNVNNRSQQLPAKKENEISRDMSLIENKAGEKVSSKEDQSLCNIQ